MQASLAFNIAEKKYFQKNYAQIIVNKLNKLSNSIDTGVNLWFKGLMFLLTTFTGVLSRCELFIPATPVALPGTDHLWVIAFFDIITMPDQQVAD